MTNGTLIIMHAVGFVLWATANFMVMSTRARYLRGIADLRTALADLLAAQEELKAASAATAARRAGPGVIGALWYTGDGVPIGPGAVVWTPARDSEFAEARWELVTVMAVGVKVNIVEGTTPEPWRSSRPNWMLFADRPEWPAGEAKERRERAIAEHEAKRAGDTEGGKEQRT